MVVSRQVKQLTKSTKIAAKHYREIQIGYYKSTVMLKYFTIRADDGEWVDKKMKINFQTPQRVTLLFSFWFFRSVICLY